MLQIVNFFWQICLLRQSPQKDYHHPGSPQARPFWPTSLIALGVVALTRPDQPLSTITGTLAIGLTLQAGVTFLLLQFKGYRHRFNATWSALLGANAIMLLILLPFNFIILNSDNDDSLDVRGFCHLGLPGLVAGYRWLYLSQVS